MWFLGVWLLCFPAFMLDSYRPGFRRLLSFIIGLFPQAAGSPSVSPPPRDLFEVFFALASVPPQPVCLALFCVALLVLWCFCLIRISGSLRDVGSLWDESGLLRPLFISFSGLLHVVVSILYRSPFRSSDSFASKVLLATGSPFEMSLASFGTLSTSNFRFFPDAVPFSTRRIAFALPQALPWYLSAVEDIGLCGVIASIVVLCLLFVSSHQSWFFRPYLDILRPCRFLLCL